MGMADVRRAFHEGLGGKATCTDAQMTYSKGDEPGQSLVFRVQTAGGDSRIVERVIPHGSNLNDEAKLMATTFAATL